MPVDPVDDLAVHLDQPPVGVVGESRVAGRPPERLGGRRVQAEVEDRVHHPGHRDRRARADRDEQRVRGVAEALARLLLEPGDVLVDLRRKPVGKPAAQAHVLDAGLGRHDEPGRDGNPERGHLREARALAPEQARGRGRPRPRSCRRRRCPPRADSESEAPAAGSPVPTVGTLAASADGTFGSPARSNDRNQGRTDEEAYDVGIALLAILVAVAVARRRLRRLGGGGDADGPVGGAGERRGRVRRGAHRQAGATMAGGRKADSAAEAEAGGGRAAPIDLAASFPAPSSG